MQEEENEKFMFMNIMANFIAVYKSTFYVTHEQVSYFTKYLVIDWNRR